MEQTRRRSRLRPNRSLPLLATAVSTLAFLVPATLGASSAAAADQPPVFTSAPTVTFSIGLPQAFAVTATGSPAPTFTETGALPSGVSLTMDGILGGTPAVGSGGSYQFTITASNDAGSARQLFTLLVPLPPAEAVGVEGSDGQLWVQAPQLPGGWRPEGGRVIAAPAVTAPPNPHGVMLAAPVLFIATGTDHRLYVRSLTAGWQLLSASPAYCLNGPAAVITGTAPSPVVLTVACEGADHGLWENSTTITSLSGLPQVTGPWESLGGVLAAGPAVAPVGGVLTFFATGANGGQVWTRTLDTGFTPQPWWCIGRPAAALFGTLGESLFACEGTDHGLWEAFWGAAGPGTGWLAPEQLEVGVPLTGSPAVAGTGSGSEIFYEATGTAVWEIGPPGQLGGSVIDGVGATGLD